jgi:hypothetical protein
MFDRTPRAGMAGLLCLMAAGLGGCDTRGAVPSAAKATEARSDQGKVIVWQGMPEQRDRTSAARPANAGAGESSAGRR